ncbi:hypothetical protein KKI17_00890 [Patescibacteria group bacterium]|nr:hypothetical protein [Patescibacteria group bacterium]
MTKECAVCAKRQRAAWKRVKLRGKYNPTVKHLQKPNIQWIRLTEPFAAKWGFRAGTRIRACTKCIKSLSKLK